MPRRIERRAQDEEPEEESEEQFQPEDDDDEEEERPARGVKSAARKASRDGDDDERPKRPSGVRKGWGGARRTKEMSSDFPEELKVTEEAVLVKFLEDEPFASYRQHWIEREGKKSFTCLEDDCPLCDIGDRPAGRYAFNVLLLSEGEPTNKVWVVGNRLEGTLENYAKDKKTGPLTRLYWSVSRTGKGSNTQHNISPVKERDLPEDWDVEALDDDVIAKYAKQCWDDSSVSVQTRKQMQAIADEVSDEE
jgi:hypothetical protein